MNNTVLEPALAAGVSRAAQVGGEPSAIALTGKNLQFVTFHVSGQVFAVPMQPVQEIIRLPEVIGVPLSPPSLKGLANLRGSVLPVVSLRQVFGFEEKVHDDATRVVVINFGTPVGFIVDQVASVITASEEQVEQVQAIEATINTEMLLGVLKDLGGNAIVMILDFFRLISNQFSGLGGGQTGARAQGMDVETAAAQTTASDEMQLVSFTVAGQEYAIGIDQVQEIVQVPAQIMQVPNSDAHVLGVMTLRNRLLPLVSLRRMFALPAQALSEHNRIVVISSAGERSAESPMVGVVMDSVNEVLRVSRAAAEELSSLLSGDGGLAEISAICRLDGGKRLVSILTADKLFAHRAMRSALAAAQSMEEEGGVTQALAEAEVRTDDEEHMVVFRLAREEFGVPIEAVHEIVRVPEELTHIPRAPAFIEGVINLRGSVLPVVDQRRRFGMETLARNDRQRIMVFAINGMRTGFIVDSVAEVVKIPKQCIEPAPRIGANQMRLMRRVANMQAQKRMVLLLDVDQLLDIDEVSALEGMGV